MSELIKIKYEIDSSDVKQAESDLVKLQKAEADLSKQASATNAQMNAQGVSIAKADIATKNMQKTLASGSGSKQINEASEAVNKLGANLKALPKPNIEKNMQGASQSVNGFSTAIKGLAGIVAGAFAFEKIIEFGKAVIDTTAQFQKFEAVLTNTLGSNSAAKQAMAEIQQFAAATPFSVKELTDSFVKLSNSGFVPTQNQMRQLGDIASSTGKDFMQLTEAILDASSGEFERLKEFGIKSSKEGDKITFTFKGIKTQVQNTSESINKYILGLGDLKGVSGGMEAISKTLGGQISNLGDSFDQVKLKIGKDLAPVMSVLIGYLSNMGSLWDFVREKVSDVFAPVGRLVKAVTDLAGTFGITGGSVDILGGAMSALSAVIDQMTFFFRAGVETAVLFSQVIGTVLNSAKELSNFLLNTDFKLNADLDITKLDDKISAYKTRAMNGFKDVNNEIKKEEKATGDSLDDIRAKMNKKTEQVSEEAKKKAMEAEKDGAKKLRDLRQQNAILSAKDDLDKARLKIKFDYENAKEEVKLSSKTAEIKKELAKKQVLELAEAERKARAEAREKDLQAIIDSQEVLFTTEKQKYEKLQAEKMITTEQFGNAMYGLELENLSKRETAYNAYLATIDTTTKDGLAKFQETQKEITKINEDENDLRTKNITETLQMQADALQKANDAQIALLELRKKYGTGEVAQKAVTDLGDIKASQATDPQAKADARIDAEAEVLDMKLQAFDKEHQAELESLDMLAQVYAQRNAIVADSYDKQIAIAKASGLETTGLEQKKNDALQKSNADEKKAFYTNLNNKLSAVQQYGGQVVNAYAQLSDVYYAGLQKELDAQANANAKKLSDNEQALSITRGRLEKATGKQKKELQIQLANEENIKRQTLKNAEEIEKKKEELRKEQAIIKKATAIGEAIINTALAVTASLAQTPPPAGLPLALLVGALGAAQVATIIAQPLAKGTLNVKGGVEGKDSVLANLMPGEAVIPTKISRKYANALEAIYHEKVQPEAFDRVIKPKQTAMHPLVLDKMLGSEAMHVRAMQRNSTTVLEGQISELNASLQPLNSLNISQLQGNMDSQGFSQYLQEGNMRTKILGKISV